MNEFLKVLLNIRSLRAAIRELPFEQLLEAKEKFDLVYQERAASVEQDRAEQEERQRKLNEFTEMLQQAGIDPRELLASAAAPAASTGAAKSKRAPRPAKYQYEEDGQMKTWTGQGRMPKAIAAQVALGKDLNDFLI
ncbi:transcriptional regulator [Aeromonas sobria]|uniref:DNA-binding protein n=1 Tax=Aeromonas sobria TaxID=646 RepID=A0A2N3J3P5_AERSO|nr:MULTISPECIES: H-NS family nucleoid-associated regulatory protein [Aeromonas]PKQ80469.1 transcriptional regulator [Aeromonas sobria]PKQ83197.1 transcriptional regulator [Aeromonas sobria]TNH91865.1 transcriptional regulator [Aeromonas sobria]WOE83556.1 H-NS family nucleoid-associated regulatory protein [Aeromonas veronii]HEH9426635.1 H-NS histone family protein [Aeromonas sobria]